MANQEKISESYDSHLANSIKRLFLPDWLEIILYVLSAGVLLCVLNYRVFLNSVSNSSNVSQDVLSNYLHTKLTSVGDFAGGLLQGRLTNMLFWAFVGCLIYMAVWTLQNLIINLRNDVKAGRFVSVENQTGRRKAYWTSVVSSKIFFICSLLAVFIYLVALSRFMLPVASRYFGLAISTDFRFPGTIFSVLLSLLGTTLLLFVLVLGVRIVSRSWRWIIGNF